MAGLKFPPKDLNQTLTQQLMLLQAAREAVTSSPDLPQKRTSVLVGMQCDAQVARYGLRWRLAEWYGDEINATELDEARQGVIPALESAGVVGNMPNIVANRLNSQFDLGGPSLAISSEEASGLVALNLAGRQLRHHEVDAAIVGAVDLCCEPVQAAAAQVLQSDRHIAGDAAVVMVLKRLEDAQRDGNTVLAVIDQTTPSMSLGLAPNATALTSQFGHSHCATGLVHAAAAVVSCHTATQPDGTPWKDTERSVQVIIETSFGQRARTTFRNFGEPTSIAPHVQPTGPAIQRSGHPEPIAFLSLENAAMAQPQSLATSPASSHTHQSMAPAPSLVPTSYDEPHTAIAAAAPELAASRVTASQVQVPVARPPAPVSVTPQAPQHTIASQDAITPVAQTLAEHQRLVGEAHRNYLQQSAAVHARFMAMRQNAVNQLLGVAGAAAHTPAVQRPPAVVSHAVPVAQSTPPKAVSIPVPPPSAPTPSRVEPPKQEAKRPIIPDPASVQSKPSTLVTKAQTAVSRPKPTGLTLSREQLEVHASGNISEIYGPLFQQQDEYALQVRMPEPPYCSPTG